MFNRNRLLSIPSRFALGLAAGLISLSGFNGNAQAEIIGAVVLEEYRGATAVPEAASDAHEIRFQDQVSAMETVNTDDNGVTSLQFLDQSRFDVGPNASVRLDEFIFDPATANGAGKISMAIGAFRYVGGVMKTEDQLKLITPTATMSIRGSEVVIYVGIDGSTEADVVSGELTVLPCKNGDPLVAKPGERIVVDVACAAVLAQARPLADGFAALDVPEDIGDFSTAAGGNDDGGNNPPDRDHSREPPPHEPKAPPAPPAQESPAPCTDC